MDTSVWSLALRRDSSGGPEVKVLEGALAGGYMVLTTGLVLQELLQGFQGPSAAKRIMKDFSMLPMVSPQIEDHIQAAQIRNRCRRKGVQVETIDALIAQLCIRHELSLLTTDRDFDHIAKHTPLRLRGRYSD